MKLFPLLPNRQLQAFSELSKLLTVLAGLMMLGTQSALAGSDSPGCELSSQYFIAEDEAEVMGVVAALNIPAAGADFLQADWLRHISEEEFNNMLMLLAPSEPTAVCRPLVNYGGNGFGCSLNPNVNCIANVSSGALENVSGSVLVTVPAHDYAPTLPAKVEELVAPTAHSRSLILPIVSLVLSIIGLSLGSYSFGYRRGVWDVSPR